MATSVPHVHPVEDFKWRIATLIEQALEMYRRTGDITTFEQSVKLARELYESHLKLAGNKGTMDWSYINKYAPALEKVENIVQRIKAKGV